MGNEPVAEVLRVVAEALGHQAVEGLRAVKIDVKLKPNGQVRAVVITTEQERVL